MYIFCLISKKGQFYGLSYETFLTGCSCVYVMSCPTLCNSLQSNLPGSSVHGILQTGILEWVAIFFLQRIVPT